ncbi:splicing factor U2AF 65 kDa subunit-like isoform X3 [Cebidichthys violaceus]|uniref:splicing factor U2AF 65 kDa subunit-like isoform X3 n=1 Tax=Cebidichthys violaceus TaxID=271503 RepID=UPI0035CAA962
MSDFEEFEKQLSENRQERERERHKKRSRSGSPARGDKHRSWSKDRGSRSREKRSRSREKRSRSREKRSRSREKRSRDRRSSSRDHKKHSHSPRRTRKKRTCKYWDVPPPGFEHITPMQYKAMQAAGQIPTIALLATSTTTTTTTGVAAAPTQVPIVGSQMTRQARRLYVGNIPFGVTEPCCLLSSSSGVHGRVLQRSDEARRPLASPEQPCARCADQSGQKLCFLRVPVRRRDDAGDGLRRDHISGRRLHGRSRLPPQTVHRRPAQLPERRPGEGALDFVRASQGVQPREGQCHVAVERLRLLRIRRRRRHRSVAGLNGMQLGDKKLIVQRASVGAKNANPTSIIETPVTLQVPGLQRLQNSGIPTEVLCLLNMVMPEELVDDEDYEEILEDIREECCKYGSVRSIEIPRPVDGVEVPGCGKIFVEYVSAADCQKAMQALTGRKFANRVVVTKYYDPDMYHRHDF